MNDYMDEPTYQTAALLGVAERNLRNHPSDSTTYAYIEAVDNYMQAADQKFEALTAELVRYRQSLANVPESCRARHTIDST